MNFYFKDFSMSILNLLDSIIILFSVKTSKIVESSLYLFVTHLWQFKNTQLYDITAHKLFQNSKHIEVQFHPSKITENRNFLRANYLSKLFEECFFMLFILFRVFRKRELFERYVLFMREAGSKINTMCIYFLLTLTYDFFFLKIFLRLQFQRRKWSV